MQYSARLFGVFAFAFGTWVGSATAQPIVAVIDSGIDDAHPEFAGRIVGGFDHIDGDAVPDDLHGHGTAMAGLIAGSTTGVCPTCLIVPVKVMDASTGTAQAIVAQGIDVAVILGVDLIYIGLAAPGMGPELASSIASAAAAGIPVVAPAGNDTYEQTWYPAADPSVISVASVDANHVHVAFGNTGGFETIAAVGADVTVPEIGGGYTTASGTSAAAAVAAGIAARALDQDPSLTPSALAQLLRFATDLVQTAFFADYFDYGVANLTKVLARGAIPGLVDTTVQRMVVLPKQPLVGQAAIAEVTIANAGQVATGGSTLDVVWDGTPLPSIPVGALAAGQQTTITVALPGLASAGSVSLDVHLGTPGDAEPANDDRSQAVTITTSLDDDIDIVIGPLTISPPIAGVRTASYPFTLRNLGNQPATMAHVDVLVNGSVIATHNASLAVSDQVPLVASWTFPDTLAVPRGDLQVMALLDSAVESEIRNNAWGHTFRVDLEDTLIGPQYADSMGPNFVMDAPWMTIRDYIPVLAFAPQVSGLGPAFSEVVGSAYLKKFQINQYHPITDVSGPVILRDAATNALDIIPGGTTFLSADGFPRGNYASPEAVNDFWHYIVRLPVGLVIERSDGYRYMHTTMSGGFELFSRGVQVAGTIYGYLLAGPFGGYLIEELVTIDVPIEFSRVLRFRLGGPFPAFVPTKDRHYDVHVHTIAEQTQATGVFAPNKNFGGPLAMVAESSYALGLVDVPLTNGDWSAFKNRLVVTDHNVFYSTAPYDTPTSAPGYGPTSTTAGGVSERNWYRTNLGAFAGEEVALQSGPNQPPTYIGPGNTANAQDRFTQRKGHHLLVYASRHFEGPWHGGKFGAFVPQVLFFPILTPPFVLPVYTGNVTFLGDNTPNPNRVDQVLSAMKDDGPAGFAYAAHPDASSHFWHKSLFDIALGVQGTFDGAAPNNSQAGPHVHPIDFVFKGSQVWNQKLLRVGQQPGGLNPLLAWRINPFDPTGLNPTRLRTDLAWAKEMNTSLDRYFDQVQVGLGHFFFENPLRRFIRKHYVAAGTDAHGDFNYTDDVESTLSGGFTTNHNAYGLVRTYTLAHERDPSGGDLMTQQDAYRDGNTVLTDGPICKFDIDSDGRHNPGAAPRWHDASTLWENPEGQIGGAGAFDGLRTVLVPHRDSSPLLEPDAYVRTNWLRSESPDAQSLDVLQLFRVTPSTRPAPVPFNPLSPATPAFTHVALPAGPEATPDPSPLTPPITDLSAFMLQGQDIHTLQFGLPFDERCLTNPVWAVPVKINVSRRGVGCPMAPGDLTVTFEFPVSMLDAPDTVVAVRPLDGNGDSTDPEVPLVPAPGWTTFQGVLNGRYTAENAAQIPCPPADWDARIHAPGDILTRSYVVYMRKPTDTNNNVLNDIGRTFVVKPDHFQCYEAKPETLPAISGVSIEDRFSSGVSTLRYLQRLCAPANKNGEDPDAADHIDHLAGYQFHRRFKPVRGVEITNQFGTVTLDVIRPKRLLVPTLKHLFVPPAGQPFGDHFTCYKVRPSRGAPRFISTLQVTVQDQFGPFSARVERPEVLCTPANKNGEDPTAPTHPTQYLCYPLRPDDPFGELRPYIHNQFGDDQATLVRRMELCVPSVIDN